MQRLTDLQAIVFSEVVGEHYRSDVQRLIEALESEIGAPHTDVKTIFTNSIGMELLLIPRGTFMMGSPDADAEADDNEKPAHRVTISQPFYLGKHPVTQAQWATVMGNNQSIFSKVFLALQEQHQPSDDRIRILERRARIYTQTQRARGVTHYCLPTEAQWEYACRAATETPRYDQALDNIAWYQYNSDADTPHPVGQKMPNAWGLYDTPGNVSEWCHGGWRTYTTDSVVDPIGSTDFVTVVRGGSWLKSAQYVRAAAAKVPCLVGFPVGVGFRLARLYHD